MKKEDLFKAFNGIDETYIERAHSSPDVRKKSWINWVLAAACILLLVGSSSLFLSQKDSSQLTPIENSHLLTNEKGYYVPAIELPKETGTTYDMIGTLVYKGKIYTQAESYYDDTAEAVEPLVGDYLGRAVGNLDEWSTQDDYAKEFASTYLGDVYSVKGYDTSFRLCIYNSGDNKSMIILENLNNIYLDTGADLFDTRLHLPHNWDKVNYLTHSNWDNGGNNYKELNDISKEDINVFLEELCKNPFVYMDSNETPNLYNSKSQGHLFFTMKDSTRIELRLMEGGYVGYQNLGWYFVKIPGEAFDKIFHACQ